MSEQIAPDFSNQAVHPFISRKAFFIILAATIVVSALITRFIYQNAIGNSQVANGSTVAQSETQTQLTIQTGSITPKDILCDVIFFREKDFKLIKPLLFADAPAQSDELKPLNDLLSSKIQELERANILTKATVYYKEINTTRWTVVNGYHRYHPGSMLKIATMICIFKMMEKDPTFKEKQIFLSSNLPLGVSVHPPHPLRAGQSYSVRQLLQAMIEFSDNDATGLLFKEVNQADYAGLFTDLGIEVPEIYGWDYTITASDYARFYRVLYNASYLNRASSEMALTLLTQTTFKNGMVKNFPANVIVAHKFGERMTEVKSLQFHDAGIVYVGNRPYVAVFMTEGMNIDVLPDAIAQLSSICYDYAIAQK